MVRNGQFKLSAGGDVETVANNATTQVAHDETTSVGGNTAITTGSASVCIG